MRIYFTLLVIFLSCGCFGQILSSRTKDSLTIVSLQEKQKNLETEINTQNSKIEKLEATSASKIKEVKDDVNSTLALYAGMVVILAGLIGFSINFFGKTAIKKRVEELITETAQAHTEKKIVETLNSTLTNELIEEVIRKKSDEEIRRILGNLESTGNIAINEFRNKGDEILKSLVAAPPKGIDQTLSEENLELKKESDEYFNLAFNSKDSRVKIDFYKKVLELEPNNVSAFNNIGVAYNEIKETDEAITVLNKAILLDPNYFLAFANRGNAYLLSENLEKGLDDLNIAIKLAPTFYYSYAIKSFILRKQNKLQEAEETLLEIRKINPNSSEAAFTLAFFYEEMKRFDESLELYELAEKLNFPERAMLYNNMAVLFRRQKMFDKSLEYLEKARSQNPLFPNIDGTMALIYSDKNDDTNFYKYLEIALEKKCPVWDFLNDPGFDKYRNSKRLKTLIEPYKKKYFA